MPAAGRYDDRSSVPSDSHGCPACPHSATGPATTGSTDVLINNKFALRVGDSGTHSSCCGPNTWVATGGAAKVLINNRLAHRLGDSVQHCGGTGALAEGSPDVFIGDDVFDCGTTSTPESLFFDERFLLLTPSGQILSHTHYLIVHQDGSRNYGITDEHGLTHLLARHTPSEKVEIYVSIE